MSGQKDKTSETRLWPFAVAFLVAVLVVVGFWGANWWYASLLCKPGIFGDMFGAVNALFSGLAFAGVILAILLQREEIKLQRKDLAKTREEFKGQKEQMEKQNETLSLQSFENTFFQLLRLHHEIVNAMRHGKLEGRKCIRQFVGNFRGDFDRITEHYNQDRTLLKIVNGTYKSFYTNHQSHLGHYFRNLYNTVKFVKNGSVENKRFYTNLVRAQLSSNELMLLFYNCVSDMGCEKFKPLIEEYALLKNMPKEMLLDQSHEQFYETAAYGSSAEVVDKQ